MEQRIRERFDSLEPLIGHTPLLEISCTYKGKPRRVYAKAEYYNLSGSIKDRVAFYVLRRAYETGQLHPGDLIAEATSGNTGIAFSAVGRYLGHPVVIYMPDWMSEERMRLIRSYGAQIRLVSKEEGGFLGSIRMTEELAEKGGVFLPCQFSNEDNCSAHYLTTGAEIAQQLSSIGLTADTVVAGVGTGGTVMGIGRRLRETNPACRLYPLEPENSPTLSTGYKTGKHRIQGISDEFVPPILKLEETDAVVAVDDIDSILMAQMLARELGIGVGISSGANFLGALKAGDMLGEDAVVATVFADDNKKYLSTDYSDTHTRKPGYLTGEIQLTGVRAIRCTVQ
ncbi:PLP-dependent cysteine synthase family protein [Ruminococcus sp.]|uniref:PLP-dependent cysteine synthase family protein n=1 Tax=Ruminococcus sp. TaxID=41978 RepID=UPI002614AB95|nr:cysteine synthase family protein [Ruminococcus sp.]MDD7556460.1 cysteine synthase family protein [Ruminococcus sp.]